MVDENNTQIIIPSKHYVGIQGGIARNISLSTGWMIPEGTDQVTMKRKANIDRWANSTQGDGQKSVTIDNFPIVGFKVSRVNGRNSNHNDNSSVSWVVQDPRGFEIGISSLSLAHLIEFSTIENSEIQEKCVWGRFNSWNVLIPVTSGLYTDAIRNTDRMSKRASLRQLKPGNTVITLNGVTGVFLGNQYFVSRRYYSIKDLDFSTKRAVIAEMSDGEITNIHLVRSLRLSEITCSEIKSFEDCVKQTNDYIQSKGQINNTRYSGLIASSGKPEFKINSPTKLEEVDANDVINNTISDAVVLLSNNSYGVISGYELKSSRSTLTVRGFKWDEITGDGAFSNPVMNMNISDMTNYRFFYMVKTVETIEGLKIKTYMARSGI